jgi:hypothetical protein
LQNYSTIFVIIASVALIVAAAVLGFNSYIVIAKTTTITTTAAYALSDKEHPTRQDKYCFTTEKKDDRSNPYALNCAPTNQECEDTRDTLLDIESLEVSHYCIGYPNNDQKVNIIK